MGLRKVTDKELLIFRNEGVTFKVISKTTGLGIWSIANRMLKIEQKLITLIILGHTKTEAAITVGCAPHHVNRYIKEIDKKYD